MSIVNLAPKIVAGSALAGFGLAFGRDVYRKTKKNFLLIVVLALITIAFYGLFICCIWMTRNYRTWLGSIFKRIGAVVSFALCYSVSFILVLNLDAMIFDRSQTPAEPIDLSDRGVIFFVGIALQLILVLSGLVVGLVQRRKRRIAWDTEISNAQFFDDHGIEELDDEHLRDSEGNRYKLKNVFKDELEFQAEGRRGKRGYITFDENGKYISWSGLANIS